MKIFQNSITLGPFKRGFHIITSDIVQAIPDLKNIKSGICYLFIQHTSAGLTINENADPDVRKDLESSLNHVFRENESFYLHTIEGSDDMPAHIKASILGNNLTIPISSGKLNLGTWQGIYIGEFRNNAAKRTIVATIQGQ